MMENRSESLPEIDRLIKKICRLETSYPVIEMDSLIKIGKTAVQPILNVLKQDEGASTFGDTLPFLVVLGEIRSPEAIDALIKFMLDTENGILAEVACEALAKIGIPALNELEKIAKESKDIVARIFAYGALGYMKIPQAHRILLEALGRDKELLDVISISLSEYKDKTDIEKIYNGYAKLEDNSFNKDIEESLYSIANPPKDRKNPIEKNWRSRYRRLLAMGSIPEASVLTITIIIHEELKKDRSKLGRRAAFPKRPLEEILHDESLSFPPENEICESCGGKITFQAGLPVCPETAHGLTVFQERFIRGYIDSGIATIPEALDAVEEEEQKITKKLFLSKKARETRIDNIKVKYTTLNFFVENRIYQLGDALKKLLKIRSKIENKAGPEATPEIPDRRAVERVTWDLTRMLEEKKFASADEAGKFMGELLKEYKGKISSPLPRNNLEIAQDMMYEAWDSKDKKERIKLAYKALTVSPNCADAYVLLAEEAKSLAEAEKLYQKGVDAGERALGERTFKEDAGHFWGVIQTRPYMRARIGLAQSLWMLGEYDAAINHYKEMLRLNPGDNQGVREILAMCYAEICRYEELEHLLNRSEYKNSISASWLYTKVLLCLARNDPPNEVEKQFQEAFKRNQYVPEYLLGRRSLPSKVPEMLTLGGEDEAIWYTVNFISAWRKIPGAIDWLKSQV